MADETIPTASSCKFSDRARSTETCDHRTVGERYYTQKYKLGFGQTPYEDHLVLTHSNKVCLVTLAPSHPIIKDGKTVTAVNYQTSDNVNMLTTKVEGKSKKGAHTVSARSALCHVTCSDATSYTVRACIRGHVVEVNAMLVSIPQLLTQKTQTAGYVAIILCKLNDYQEEMGRLLTPAQYREQLEKRREQHVTRSASTEEPAGT